MFSPSPSRMPCSASDVRPIARAGRSQPMALRGLPFPVVASARGRAAARRIARRVAATCGLLESVLGTAPSVALRVLDRGDWHRHAEVPAYGVTHVADNGDLVTGASAADPWHDVRKLACEQSQKTDLIRGSGTAAAQHKRKVCVRRLVHLEKSGRSAGL